jgi:hypothetical protein
MSSFTLIAKNKTTGELTQIYCIDDYFGKHKYGYIPNIAGGEALTFEQFENLYEAQETGKENETTTK